ALLKVMPANFMLDSTGAYTPGPQPAAEPEPAAQPAETETAAKPAAETEAAVKPAAPAVETQPAKPVPETQPADPVRLLGKGAKGPDVKEMQERLIYYSFLPGDGADGFFGPITLEGVTGFQQANGLVPDGIVGPLTRKA